MSKNAATIMEHRFLLSNFKFNLNFWFLSKFGNEIDNSLVTSCVDIICNGLLDSVRNGFKNAVDLKTNNAVAQKFIDDFEWVRRSTLIRDISFEEITTVSRCYHQQSKTSVQQFLAAWVLRNLESKTMCSSIQALFSEKELLQNYFNESAFLRNECYANAFIIGLSAFELNQCSLLSQINEALYTTTNIPGGNITVSKPASKHKRTTSHPNFSLSLVNVDAKEQPANTPEATKTKQLQQPVHNEKVNSNKIVFPAFRKIKSLPIISNTSTTDFPNNDDLYLRPRSKTMNQSIIRRSLPVPIKKSTCKSYKTELDKFKDRKYTRNIISNEQPSTSVNSCGSQLSGSSMISNTSTNTTSSSSNSTSYSAAHTAGITDKNQARRIELINCDDIKIWTDQSSDSKSSLESITKTNLNRKSYPSPVPINKTKNVSPLNSFLSSLFGTPPTYSNWYVGDIETEEAFPAAQDIQELQNNSVCNSSFNSTSVLDAFLPVYGKKVQTKQKSNLFEDDISNLNCITTTTKYGNTPQTSQKLNEKILDHSAAERTPNNCQSLTAFLQMAHLTRNNTDLEKENAHFRISEAIISAIEHMKWAKTHPDQIQQQNGTVVATDWLENERNNPNTTKCATAKEEIPTIEASEYMPYIEHAETCHEDLSAEVVGLSLISRFNDKHLPKVSELKWLVSDEDTPQQLLPMPDTSPTSNPDEHVFPSMTRGTKYWAPPRAQIIFTDHPIPNRKEIIRKQNNRCAGCGMRVSQQLQSSFRYCTYFGKYHCTGCHRNQMSAIPAKILQMWDFKCYPVSVFAYRLLGKMHTYPLFHVPDLNPALYVKSKHLLEARNKRLKLKFIKDFIKACRFSCREQNYFDTIPDYITNDVDIWSMSDFVDVRNESMQRSIHDLIEKCENHIFHCVLCTGRGFCCEYCHREHVIYPWGNKVFRCDRCGSCFHLNCWKSMLEVCCRCQRIQNRQNEAIETISK